MKTYLLLLQLVVATCLTSDDRGIELSDTQEVYNQQETLELAQQRFEAHYGVEVDISEAEIYWTDTPCPHREEEWAVVYLDTCFYGYTFSCGEMYVARNKESPYRTCQTALVHEVGHCLRLAAGWDGDADHSEEEFWDLMGDIRKDTCIRDW